MPKKGIYGILRVMYSVIDEIKNRLDIVEVVGSYIRLQKAGRNYRALCPFHSEKTPSFFVSPERQMWHCFGCGLGGSIFDFVMRIEGIEFGDALRLLAKKAGVTLKKTDPQLQTKRKRLYEICELATRFFEKQLKNTQIGQQMLAYLKERGLNTETIQEWRLGYAPASWQALSEFLQSRGYQTEEIIQAGLLVKSEDGFKIYDRFRDRIIFPIFDFLGNVIGFSGRENPQRPDERMGKYINTPNTLIYDKSRVLYGLDKAKLEIRQKDFCLLVEGQLDVIMSHQAGLKTAVACSGTSLTEEHLKIIKRYTENLLLAFDQDLAGQKATQRSLDLTLAADLNPRVVRLPLDTDPADCIKENPQKWLNLVKKAEPLMEFYFSLAFSQNDKNSVEGKRKITDLLLPVIKKIPHKIEQAHWVQQLSQRLKTEEKFIWIELEKTKPQPNQVSSSVQESQSFSIEKSPLLKAEERMLGLLFNYPEYIKEIKDECKVSFLKDQKSQIIFQKLKNYPVENFNLKEFQKELEPQLATYIDYLSLKAADEEIFLEEESKKKPLTEIRFCLAQLKKNYYQTKLEEIRLKIKAAESEGKKDILKELLKEANLISRELGRI